MLCGIRSLVEGQAGPVIPPEKKPANRRARESAGQYQNLYARFKEGCGRVMVNQVGNA